MDGKIDSYIISFSAFMTEISESDAVKSHHSSKGHRSLVCFYSYLRFTILIFLPLEVFFTIVLYR